MSPTAMATLMYGSSENYLPNPAWVRGIPRRPSPKVVRDWVSGPDRPKNLLRSRVRRALIGARR
jgi:hypothetical protein